MGCGCIGQLCTCERRRAIPTSRYFTAEKDRKRTKSGPNGGLGPDSAQKRRDVDLVVRDLERLAIALADPRAAVALAGRAPRLLARRARAGAPVVEAGGDD